MPRVDLGRVELDHLLGVLNQDIETIKILLDNGDIKDTDRVMMADLKMGIALVKKLTEAKKSKIIV